MTTAAFDTHEFIRNLRDAGFTEPQAEAVSRAMTNVLADHEIATRRDLRETETRLETRLEARMTTLISEAKIDMMKWITGMLLAQAGLITALIKLL